MSQYKVKNYQVNDGRDGHAEEKVWLLSIPLGDGTELRSVARLRPGGTVINIKLTKEQLQAVQDLIDKLEWRLTKRGKIYSERDLEEMVWRHAYHQNILYKERDPKHCPICRVLARLTVGASKLVVVKPCLQCIDGPERFSGAIMPLSECFELGWHVHKSGRGYVVYRDKDLHLRKRKK